MCFAGLGVLGTELYLTGELPEPGTCPVDTVGVGAVGKFRCSLKGMSAPAMLEHPLGGQPARPG